MTNFLKCSPSPFCGVKVISAIFSRITSRRRRLGQMYGWVYLNEASDETREYVSFGLIIVI